MKTKILFFVFMTSIACITFGQNKPVNDMKSTNPASHIQYKQTTPIMTDNQLRQVPTNQPQQIQPKQYHVPTTIRTNNEMKKTKDDPRPHVQSQTKPVIIYDIKTTQEFKRATGDTMDKVIVQKLRSDTMTTPNNNDKFGCCCEVYDNFSKRKKIVWCPSGPIECDNLKGRPVDSYRCNNRPK